MQGLAQIRRANLIAVSSPPIAPNNFGQIAEGNDFHRRRADREAGDALSAENRHRERTALAWGRKAIHAIQAGNFDIAINQLTQAIKVTSNSQYNRKNFDGRDRE